MRQTEFFVDDIRYVWAVTDCHSISFRLDEKNEKVRLLDDDGKPWEWAWDGHVRSLDLTGVARHPLRVFRKATELAVAWVADARPGFFGFHANDRRKAHVYRVLIRRWLRRLPVQYGWHEHDDNFYFYRLDAQMPANAA